MKARMIEKGGAYVVQIICVFAILSLSSLLSVGTIVTHIFSIQGVEIYLVINSVMLCISIILFSISALVLRKMRTK